MDETKVRRPKASVPSDDLIERASRLLPQIVEQHALLFKLLA